MSAKVPWTDPGGTPCCCQTNCEHTYNVGDPTKWDSLNYGGFAATSQIELTPLQHTLLTTGGTIIFEASGTSSGSRTFITAGGDNLQTGQPDPDRVTTGEFYWSIHRTIQAEFLPNSCKQAGLVFQETELQTDCLSTGTTTGTGADFYQYNGGAGYTCVPLLKTMLARFSFYNADGLTEGKLFPVGMYYNLYVFFGIDRELWFGAIEPDDQGVFGFGMVIEPRFGMQNTNGTPTQFVDFNTGAGTLSLPVIASTSPGFQAVATNQQEGGTAQLTFSPSAP